MVARREGREEALAEQVRGIDRRTLLKTGAAAAGVAATTLFAKYLLDNRPKPAIPPPPLTLESLAERISRLERPPPGAEPPVNWEAGLLIGQYGLNNGVRVRGPTPGSYWNVARAFNAGGEVLAIMSASPGPDGGTELWRKASGNALMNYSSHTILNASFSSPATVEGGFGYDTVTTDRMTYTPQAAIITPFQGYPLLIERDIAERKISGYHEKNNTAVAIGIPAPTRLGTPTFTTPEFSNYATAAVAGSQAGIHSTVFNLYRSPGSSFGRGVQVGFRFRLNQTTLCRLWVGLTSALLGSVDDPTPDTFIGLRYSTDAGDTALQIISADGTGILEQASIGGAIAASNFTLYIDLFNDIIILTKGTSTMFSTQLSPGLNLSAANLGFQATIETRTAAAKNMRLGHIRAIEPNS